MSKYYPYDLSFTEIDNKEKTKWKRKNIRKLKKLSNSLDKKIEEVLNERKENTYRVY